MREASCSSSSICFRTRLISWDTSPNLCIRSQADAASARPSSQAEITKRQQQGNRGRAYGGRDGAGPLAGRRRRWRWTGLGGDGEHAAEAAPAREGRNEPRDAGPAEPAAVQEVRRRSRRRCRGLHDGQARGTARGEDEDGRRL
jgi:hypothetical protein